MSLATSRKKKTYLFIGHISHMYIDYVNNEIKQMKEKKRHFVLQTNLRFNCNKVHPISIAT